MKKLIGLRDALKRPNDRTDAIPTYLDICIDSLAHMPAKGVDSIKNWKLAEKLAELPEPFEIEDADFDRIQEAVAANPCGYLSWTQGQMLIRAEAWRRPEQGEGGTS